MRFQCIFPYGKKDFSKYLECIEYVRDCSSCVFLSLVALPVCNAKSFRKIRQEEKELILWYMPCLQFMICNTMYHYAIRKVIYYCCNRFCSWTANNFFEKLPNSVRDAQTWKY
uniref:Uncharacterized protein n=1 Tax=Micrurus lemniscatus lemniscatus TaxID=129467 RepID=A0A2D4JGV5_MICLE